MPVISQEWEYSKSKLKLSERYSLSKIPTWNNEFRITSGNIELRFEKQINELRSEHKKDRG